MASYPRYVSQFAAATGIAAILATGVPAVAADISAKPGEGVRKAAVCRVKRHAGHATRTASTYDAGRAQRLDCSGAWCGRQFVLIVGIAY